jgi:hypothetical protein
MMGEGTRKRVQLHTVWRAGNTNALSMSIERPEDVGMMMVKVRRGGGPTTHCLACREYHGTVNVNRATRGCHGMLESW